MRRKNLRQSLVCMLMDAGYVSSLSLSRQVGSVVPERARVYLAADEVEIQILDKTTVFPSDANDALIGIRALRKQVSVF